MSAAKVRKPQPAEKRPGRWLAAAGWFLTAAAALVPLATGYVPFVGRLGIFMSDSTISAQSAALGILVGGAALCWSVALVRGEARLKRVPYAWLLAAFVVLAIASTATALDRTVAVFGNQDAGQGLLAIAAYVAVFLLATQVLEGSAQFVRIVEVMVVSAGVVALFGVLQVLGLPYFPLAQAEFLTERGTSSLGNPDTLGTFLIVPLLLSLALSLASRGRRMWLWLTCAAVLFASLLLTQTRGAWLGALVALAIFGVIVYRSPREGGKGWAKWAVAGLFVLVGVVVALFEAAPGGRPLFRRLTEAAAGSSGGRLFVWSQILKVVARYPILGVGPDNILYGWYRISTSAQVHSMGIDGAINEAHNYWLGTAAVSGVLAALVLVAFVVCVLVASRSAVTERLAIPRAPSRVAYAALWAGVVGLGVALVFSPVIAPVGLMLWLSLGLLALPKVKPISESASRARTYAAIAVAAIVGLLLAGWGAATGLSSATEYTASGSAPARLAAAQAASRIAPWRQTPLIIEAQVLAQSGAAAEQVVPVVDRLIALAPDGYDYYVLKAQLLSAQPKLVIETAEKGLAVYPAGQRLILLRAVAQATLGDFAPAERDAAAAWAMARDVIPTYREPSVGLIYAQILAEEGKNAQARAVLGQLQGEFPGNAEVQNLQSRISTGGK